jgi:hypothetical protein
MPKLRRVKVVKATSENSGAAPFALVPVDMESGLSLAGVVRCEIVQSDYGDLPKLIIEIIDFDADFQCQPPVE